MGSLKRLDPQLRKLVGSRWGSFNCLLIITIIIIIIIIIIITIIITIITFIKSVRQSVEIK